MIPGLAVHQPPPFPTLPTLTQPAPGPPAPHADMRVTLPWAVRKAGTSTDIRNRTQAGDQLGFGVGDFGASPTGGEADWK